MQLFIIALLLLSALQAEAYKGPFKYTQEIFTPTEQWAVDLIYEGLEAVDALCREHNLTYVVTGGTLLGSYWYGGLIPWDDDADISMLESDIEKFLKLAPKLRKRGFEISESEWGYYISPIHGIPTRKGQKYPAIDLFAVKLRDGKYRSASDVTLAHWPNEYFTKREWRHITDVPFGHLTLRGHRRKYAERMLNTTYGTNWREVAVIWWDHKNECPREKIFVRLTDHSHVRHSAFKK